MSLDRIMNAEAVAIVGASRNETKRGFQAIRLLLEEKYEGRIFPVNPKEKRILGLKCFPSVSDIDEPTDLALICTPARTVAAILAECGRKGIKGAVILANGFGEIGKQGRALEDEMVGAARENGVRLIGPNTSGMFNLKSQMNLVGIRNAPKGDIALLTQSGNMALTLITEAQVKSRKGFSYYVGVGNEADIRFHEYLAFFREDPDTRAILMYVEGMRAGREFLQEAYRTTRKKPVILLKSGRSLTGKRSAGSHTGALAGISEVAKGAFERAGITVIENSDQLFPAAETLSSLPYIKNKNVAILADGGGHATIAADNLTDLGVNIPQLSPKTQENLRKILPSAAAVFNPVDVAGGTDADPSVLAACARIILKDPNVGGLLIVGLFGGYGIRFTESLSFIEEDTAHQLGKLVRRTNKAIVLHSLFTSANPHALDLVRYYDIPVYDSLDVACKCIGVLADYGNFRRRYQAKTNFILNPGAKAKPEMQEMIRKARAQGRGVLLEHEAKKLFEAHGAAVFKDVVVQTAAEAVWAAQRIAGAVAMKVVSPDILHKSDAGAVALNLSDPEEIEAAFEGIVKSAQAYAPEADIRGVLVAPMASKGIEVIAGTKYDDQFGPIIMFGLGGVFVEILKDVAFRVLPITLHSAQRMITELKSVSILDGARGQSAADKKAIARLLVKVSEIAEAYPEIREMDLNPVIVHEQGNGLSIVDARIILAGTD